MRPCPLKHKHPGLQSLIGATLLCRFPGQSASGLGAHWDGFCAAHLLALLAGCPQAGTSVLVSLRCWTSSLVALASDYE